LLKFGLSRVCITPDPGMELLGHPKSLKSDGKYTDLYSRSLFLSSNKGGEILIISNDLCILPTEVMLHIREEIGKETGIKKDSIIVHTTHTHAGPAVAVVFDQESSDRKQQEKIINSIINSGIKAFKNKAVGSIGIGSIDLKDISFNRCAVRCQVKKINSNSLEV